MSRSAQARHDDDLLDGRKHLTFSYSSRPARGAVTSITDLCALLCVACVASYCSLHCCTNTQKAGSVFMDYPFLFSGWGTLGGVQVYSRKKD